MQRRKLASKRHIWTRLLCFMCEILALSTTGFNFFLILRANGVIAEVRSKYKAEVSALQAQLRREQLKVQSLEKTLEQKVNVHLDLVMFLSVYIFYKLLVSFQEKEEAEELTKLCELMSV